MRGFFIADAADFRINKMLKIILHACSATLIKNNYFLFKL